MKHHGWQFFFFLVCFLETIPFFLIDAMSKYKSGIQQLFGITVENLHIKPILAQKKIILIYTDIYQEGRRFQGGKRAGKKRLSSFSSAIQQSSN